MRNCPSSSTYTDHRVSLKYALNSMTSRTFGGALSYDRLYDHGDGAPRNPRSVFTALHRRKGAALDRRVCSVGNWKTNGTASDLDSSSSTGLSECLTALVFGRGAFVSFRVPSSRRVVSKSASLRLALLVYYNLPGGAHKRFLLTLHGNRFTSDRPCRVHGQHRH